MKFKRIFLLIIDSLGVGEARDASIYNDTQVNTLLHVQQKVECLLPNLEKLGFSNTLTMNQDIESTAYYTIARPNNLGKDILSSYYELFGITNLYANKNFSDTGLPIELINNLEIIGGYRIIGNKAVTNGEDLLQILGERNINYGAIILYMTTDSSITITSHEDVIPFNVLCNIASKFRQYTENNELYRISTITVKTFTGKKIGNFKFTDDYKIFPLTSPTEVFTKTMLDNDLSVIAIGKYGQLFAENEVGKVIKKGKNLSQTLTKLSNIMDKDFKGLCITSLDEFELAAENKNYNYYGELLEELDIEIPLILSKLNNDDLLIICGSGGQDLSTNYIGHSRENIPVIIYGRNLKYSGKLPILESFSDISATIVDNFDITTTISGKSFLEKLK